MKITQLSKYVLCAFLAIPTLSHADDEIRGLNDSIHDAIVRLQNFVEDTDQRPWFDGKVLTNTAFATAGGGSLMLAIAASGATVKSMALRNATSGSTKLLAVAKGLKEATLLAQVLTGGAVVLMAVEGVFYAHDVARGFENLDLHPTTEALMRVPEGTREILALAKTEEGRVTLAQVAQSNATFANYLVLLSQAN